jgi:hypothetical protein
MMAVREKEATVWMVKSTPESEHTSIDSYRHTHTQRQYEYEYEYK